MNATKQHNISLPLKISKFIDSLPKGKKGKFIISAIEEKMQTEAQQKVREMLANLEPQVIDTDKTSVELIQEARNARSEQIINNYKDHNE